MQDYVVVVVASISGAAAVGVLFTVTFLLVRHFGRSRPKQSVSPTPSDTRVRPRISAPIFAISSNSIEKERTTTERKERISPVGNTIRKISMFDTVRRKHTPSAFSQRSLYYSDSPAVRHKEYLDFADIDEILPRKALSISHPPGQGLNTNGAGGGGGGEGGGEGGAGYERMAYAPSTKHRRSLDATIARLHAGIEQTPCEARYAKRESSGLGVSISPDSSRHSSSMDSEERSQATDSTSAASPCGSRIGVGDETPFEPVYEGVREIYSNNAVVYQRV